MGPARNSPAAAAWRRPCPHPRWARWGPRRWSWAPSPAARSSAAGGAWCLRTKHGHDTKLDSSRVVDGESCRESVHSPTWFLSTADVYSSPCSSAATNTCPWRLLSAHWKRPRWMLALSGPPRRARLSASEAVLRASSSACASSRASRPRAASRLSAAPETCEREDVTIHRRRPSLGARGHLKQRLSPPTCGRQARRNESRRTWSRHQTSSTSRLCCLALAAPDRLLGGAMSVDRSWCGLGESPAQSPPARAISQTAPQCELSAASVCAQRQARAAAHHCEAART